MEVLLADGAKEGDGLAQKIVDLDPQRSWGIIKHLLHATDAQS
jgi:hypothetical protein